MPKAWRTKENREKLRTGPVRGNDEVKAIAVLHHIHESITLFVRVAPFAPEPVITRTACLRTRASMPRVTFIAAAAESRASSSRSVHPSATHRGEEFTPDASDGRLSSAVTVSAASTRPDCARSRIEERGCEGFEEGVSRANTSLSRHSSRVLASGYRRSPQSAWAAVQAAYGTTNFRPCICASSTQSCGHSRAHCSRRVGALRENTLLKEHRAIGSQLTLDKPSSRCRLRRLPYRSRSIRRRVFDSRT